MDDTASNEEIVRLVQQGDAERFGILMDRFEPKLRRYGSRFLASEDDISGIVQDVFVQTYQNIQNFDPTQGFSAWIYRIAHNAFVSELRRRTHRPVVLPDFDLLLGHTPATEAADEPSEHAALARLVEKGLGQVKPEYREVLVLYFMEELSYKEISDVLRIPVGTVGVRIQRAKQALKQVYADLNITV